MTVSGDLATIDLAGLMQNIEAHNQTGTLTLLSDAGDARLFFREGRIALLARPGRTELVEMLARSGHVTRRRLDAARKKQKGTRHAVIEWLAGARRLPVETVREIAEARLAEDVADLVAAAHGEFRFVEQEECGPGFDADEAFLELSLAVAPLVLEATRRIDDWAEIRKFVPSGAMHFRARKGLKPPAGVEDGDRALAASLLAALDGSRSVEEVVELAPDYRYRAYKLLADFVRDRLVRPVGCGGLLEIAELIAAEHPARARVLVQRGLDTEPHHLELLAVKASLSERIGDAAAAVDAHKLLAHLHLEDERHDDAQAALRAGQRLAPNDPSLWERSLQLLLAQGRSEEALSEGMRLVELYREPGLHARAKEVLERLLIAAPGSIELHVEFARACVDCGEPRDAVRHLAGRAKALVADGKYGDARELYCAILEISPNHKEATLSIEMIDKQEFARRRSRRRRRLHAITTAAVAAVVGAFVCCDVLARIAVVQTRSLISRERMLEQGQHEDALALWQQLRHQHPLAATSWFDVPVRIADLEARIAEQETEADDGR